MAKIEDRLAEIEGRARENWPTSEDVATLAAAMRAVLAEVATFESLVRDDIGDAGIPAWGDGYLRGYHDAATDLREAIAAELGGETE